MASPLLLALAAIGAFIAYKTITFIATEIHHSRRAQQLGCKPTIPLYHGGYLGIGTIRSALKADKEYRFLSWFRQRLEDACKSDGRQHTTFHQRILGGYATVTIEPRNVQAILATQFKDFSLGSLRNNNFAPLLGKGIFSSDGEQWQHSRALLRPQFAREQVSDLDLEEHHVQNMMRVLRVRSDGWTEVIDIQTLFFCLTLDSATEFLFGESVDSQLARLPGYSPKKSLSDVDDQTFVYAMDSAQRQLAKGARFAEQYWIAHTREFKNYCRQAHAFIDQYVNIALSKDTNALHIDEKTGKPRYKFLDSLVEATRDPIEIRSQLLSILVAGRDTTASLLSYVFMLFDKHPQTYSKLRAIILEDFGTYTNPKDISFATLKSCNYLQWVLSETLRLYPVVPINSRRAVVDTTLPVGGGPDGLSPVYVRKGQQVDYSVYVIHRRKDLWGPDADEFRPERFDGRKNGWEFLPFNGGPRICIGQQFALTEAGYVLVRLLQRFEKIEGVGNSWESKERGGYAYVRQALTLTDCPADGVKLRLKEARE